MAQKIGRKKTIIIGVISIFLPFFIASFLSSWNLIGFVILFILAGFGWAAINSNSYPMVVEYASKKNVIGCGGISENSCFIHKKT